MVVYAQTQPLTAPGTVDGHITVADSTGLAPGINGTLSDSDSGPISVRIETINFGANLLRVSVDGQYVDLTRYTVGGGAKLYVPKQTAPAGYVPPGGGSSEITIQDEGVTLGPATILNFTGNVLNAGVVGGVCTIAAAPVGVNKQVQFNDNGVFGGAEGLNWNVSSRRLECWDAVFQNTDVGASGTSLYITSTSGDYGFDYNVSDFGIRITPYSPHAYLNWDVDETNIRMEGRPWTAGTFTISAFNRPLILEGNPVRAKNLEVEGPNTQTFTNFTVVDPVVGWYGCDIMAYGTGNNPPRATFNLWSDNAYNVCTVTTNNIDWEMYCSLTGTATIKTNSRPLILDASEVRVRAAATGKLALETAGVYIYRDDPSVDDSKEIYMSSENYMSDFTVRTSQAGGSHFATSQTLLEMGTTGANNRYETFGMYHYGFDNANPNQDFLSAGFPLEIDAPTIKYVADTDDGAVTAHTFDTQNALADPAAKLASFQNATVEKAFIDSNGSYQIPGVGESAFTKNYMVVSNDDNTAWFAGTTGPTEAFLSMGVDTVELMLDVQGVASVRATNSPLSYNSQPTDDAGGWAHVFDTLATLSNANIASFRNFHVEKAFIDKDGGYHATSLAASVNAPSFNITTDQGLFRLNDLVNGRSVFLWAYRQDSIAHVGSVGQTYTTLLVSQPGALNENGIGFNASETETFAQFGSTLRIGAPMASSTSPSFRSLVPDVAGISAFVFDSDTDLADSTAKLVSFQRATVEKAFIDKDGGYHATSLTASVGTPYINSPVVEFRGSAWDGVSQAYPCPVSLQLTEPTLYSLAGGSTVGSGRLSFLFFGQEHAYFKATPENIQPIQLKLLGSATGSSASCTQYNTGFQFTGTIDGDATHGTWYGLNGGGSDCNISLGSNDGSYMEWDFGATGSSNLYIGVKAEDVAGSTCVNVFAGIDWGARLVNAGSKIIQFNNYDLEVASIDKDGYITSAASPVGRKVAVPANAAAPGKPGDFAVGGGFAYFCTATDTWVRCAVAAW